MWGWLIFIALTMKNTKAKTGGCKAADLKITATIPAKAVPLFSAMVELHRARYAEPVKKHHGGKVRIIRVKTPTKNEIYARALLRWMVSDEAQEVHSLMVNQFLNS